jgi:hypothetical protein
MVERAKLTQTRHGTEYYWRKPANNSGATQACGERDANPARYLPAILRM